MPVQRHKYKALPRWSSSILHRRPLIVASVVDGQGLAMVLRMRTRAWDAVELRIDRLGVGARVLKAAANLQARGVPVIATVRMASEGGCWRDDERSREKVYQKFLPFVAAVDVEIRSQIFSRVAKAAREKNVAVIGSFHDFQGTPPQKALAAMACQAWDKGADVVKIATTVVFRRDEHILNGLLRRFRLRALCVIGMSERDPDVRVRLALRGSCLVYGCVGQPAAPGQLSCAALRRRLTKVRLRFAD